MGSGFNADQVGGLSNACAAVDDCDAAHDTFTSNCSSRSPRHASPRLVRLVRTASISRCALTLSPWMERAEHLLLIGPPAAGKSLLLASLAETARQGLESRRAVQSRLVTLHCSAHTRAAHLIALLRDACTRAAGARQAYTPKGGGGLVLHVKDVNLPSRDRYGISEVGAFVQQLVTYGGFYDPSSGLEWVSLDKVHVVCTLDPFGGRPPLETRFASTLRVAYLDGSDESDLGKLCEALMHATLTSTMPVASLAAAAAVREAAKRLAAATVDVFTAAAGALSTNGRRVNDVSGHRVNDVNGDRVNGVNGHRVNDVNGINAVDRDAGGGERLCARRTVWGLTARELTEWTVGMRRYDLDAHLAEIERDLTSSSGMSDSSPSVMKALIKGGLLEAWAYEGARQLRDRLPADEAARFDAIVATASREFNPEMWQKRPPTYGRNGASLDEGGGGVPLGEMGEGAPLGEIEGGASLGEDNYFCYTSLEGAQVLLFSHPFCPYVRPDVSCRSHRRALLFDQPRGPPRLLRASFAEVRVLVTRGVNQYERELGPLPLELTSEVTRN